MNRRLLHIALVLLFISINFPLSGQPSNTFEKDTFYAQYNAGKYKEAVNYLQQYEDSFRTLKSEPLASWLLYTAAAQSNLDNFDAAFNSYLEILNISGDNISKETRFSATVNLIELYRKLRMYDKGLVLIHKNIPNLDQYSDAIVNRFYHRAAAVYNEFNYKSLNSKHLDTAEMYSIKSIELAQKSNNLNFLATSYNELGNIYERTNRLDEAKVLFEKSINLWSETDTLNYANALKNKGSYFLRVNNYDSAIYYFNVVLNQVKSTNFNLFKNNCYWGIAQAYRQKGDSLNFYKYQVLESHYLVLEKENLLEKKIHTLSAQYDNSLKDRIIKSSQIEVSNQKRIKNITLITCAVLLILLAALIITMYKIRTKNQDLNRLNKENHFLLGEANHRIKNNLQLIISLIGRELLLDNKPNPKLTEISDKINSIAALHQQLYLKEARDKIAIKEYIENIQQNFNDGLSLTDVKINLEVEQFEIGVDSAVYFGLLITELITNSLKHAFHNSTHKLIAIKINKLNGKLVLDYSDNGGETSDKIKPSLVEILIKQLKAKKETENNSNYNIKISFAL